MIRIFKIYLHSQQTRLANESLLFAGYHSLFQSTRVKSCNLKLLENRLVFFLNSERHYHVIWIKTNQDHVTYQRIDDSTKLKILKSKYITCQTHTWNRYKIPFELKIAIRKDKYTDLSDKTRRQGASFIIDFKIISLKY